MGACYGTFNKQNNYQIEYQQLSSLELQLIDQKTQMIFQDYDPKNPMKFHNNPDNQEQNIRLYILENNMSNRVIYQILIDVINSNIETATKIKLSQTSKSCHLLNLIDVLLPSSIDILEVFKLEFSKNCDLSNLSKQACQNTIRGSIIILSFITFVQCFQFINMLQQQSKDKFWDNDAKFSIYLQDNLKQIQQKAYALELNHYYLPTLTQIAINSQALNNK